MFEDMCLGALVALFALGTVIVLTNKDDSVTIDPVKKEIKIRCRAKGIDKNNFKVFASCEKGKTHLHIKGAEVLSDTSDIEIVNRKYLIKSISFDDLKNLSYDINNRNEIIVTIPLSVVDKRIKVKYVE